MKNMFGLLFSLGFLLSSVNAETIRVGLPIEIKEIDPADLSFIEEFEVFGAVHDTLLDYQTIVGLSPVLAERWEFDKRKKTITFHLKKGLTFSDGSELNAKDVEYSYKRLILLDKSNDLTLTKCLSSKKGKFTGIHKDHPLMHVLNSQTIVLGPTDCGEPFIKQLGYPNYGIIPQKYVGKDLKLIPGAPSSGAFNYKKNPEGFSLTPNKFNWRWKNAKDKNLTFNFTKIDQDFSSIQKNKINVFRTARQPILDEAKKNGFNEIISIPVMIWFITGDVEKVSETDPFLNILNSEIDTRKYKVFENNQLEVPAVNYFPKEYRCDPLTKKVITKNMMASKGVVRLINHKSGESKIFVDDLKKDFEKHGITVLVDDQKASSYDKAINLYIGRQFLDDGIKSVLDYTYRFFKSVPDPKGDLIKKIEILDQDNLSKKDKAQLIKTICNDQYLFHHTPLAHRKFAFVYTNEKLKPLFIKSSGNLIYNNLISE